jgi:hypothetical protein
VFYSFKKLVKQLMTVLLVSSSYIPITYASVTLYDQDDAYIEASAKLQTAFFSQNNSWFGNAKENIGHNDGSWWELWAEPGIKGHFNLASKSQMYYELSYLYAQTIGDDASGETIELNNPGDGEFEQVHVGWRSGKVFSLANNLIDISLGQQDYKLGTGFLLWSGGSSGFKNGAWWIGGRHAFRDSGIFKLDTGTVKAEAFRLQNRTQIGFSKDMQGLNLEYTPSDKYLLGLTYIHVKQKDRKSIDGADIYDFRVTIDKPSQLPGFSLMAEYVIEHNGDLLDSTGWYGQVAWQFTNLAWEPQVTYRYAGLEGDDPDTQKNEAFNPLRYGFSDWNTWFQGEIIGEYVLGNSNLNTHMVKISANPIDDLSLSVFYFRFYSDQAQSRGLSSSHYADEIDFIADYSINDSFSISAVVAVAKPGDGAKEQTGGKDNWLLGMLYASYKF